MRFIHIADVHLGAEPDAGKAYSPRRGSELWERLEKIISLCRKEKTDLLLIAGDLFHRQPLLRELKELDAMFSVLEHTRVVIVAGNHDYIKPTSYYRSYRWKSRVSMPLGRELECMEFPEIKTAVYGLSYDAREIRERLYDDAQPLGRQPVEILLAHGGDEKHIPFDRKCLGSLGYAYVALGHIHRPETVESGRICYAGALEPIDRNDTGKHGFIRGEISKVDTRIEFVPFAGREYVHLEIPVSPQMAGFDVKTCIAEKIREMGNENIYKITLTGLRDQDTVYDLSGMDPWGNIVEIRDESRLAYDFEALGREHRGNLLGEYIEALQGSSEGSVEYQALFDGVEALLETKRGQE